MKAGVKDGDRIIKLNGKQVSSKQDISDTLEKIKQNNVTITIDRGGNELDLKPVVPTVGKNPEY
jgi:regulator of sigma E protease